MRDLSVNNASSISKVSKESYIIDKYTPKDEESLNRIKYLLHDLILSRRNLTFINSNSLSIVYKRVFKLLLRVINRDKQYRDLFIKILNFDEELFIHSLNVMIYSVGIAHEQKLKDNAIFSIALSSILHDIGKTFVPKDILQKPGKLNEAEFDIVKRHSESGYRFLQKNTNIPLFIQLSTLQHHERLNGTGYPNRLTSKEIHPFAKIIAVADVFDALTAERCYKKVMTPEKAINILMEGYGTAFEMDSINALKGLVTGYPVGYFVKLNNGYKAMVVRNSQNQPFHPIVSITHNEYEDPVQSYECDLSLEDVFITEGFTPLIKYPDSFLFRKVA